MKFSKARRLLFIKRVVIALVTVLLFIGSADLAFNKDVDIAYALFLLFFFAVANSVGTLLNHFKFFTKKGYHYYPYTLRDLT